MEMSFALLFLLAFALSCACATSRSLKVDWLAMVESDRAFAELSASHGIRTAFLAYLDDEGILFQPRPKNGRRHYLSLPESKDSLAWRPDFAGISRAGDMGFTTGPWEFRDEEGASRFGHYITVWRRGPDLAWYVAADGGCVHPGPMGDPPKSGAVLIDASPGEGAWQGDGSTPRTLREMLQKRDRDASACVNLPDYPKTFLLRCAENIRIYRTGSLPASNREPARALLESRADPSSEMLAWNPMGAEAARSGDLGYTYGTASNKGEDLFSYLRIWRRDSRGEWRIAVDCAFPISTP